MARRKKEIIKAVTLKRGYPLESRRIPSIVVSLFVKTDDYRDDQGEIDFIIGIEESACLLEKVELDARQIYLSSAWSKIMQEFIYSAKTIRDDFDESEITISEMRKPKSHDRVIEMISILLGIVEAFDVDLENVDFLDSQGTQDFFWDSMRDRNNNKNRFPRGDEVEIQDFMDACGNLWSKYKKTRE